MTRSMTGFAAREGAAHGWTWSWELRSVNGRGLDIRVRLPDWPDGLEPPLRATLQGRLGRGNVTLSLKLARTEGAEGQALSEDGLRSALALVRLVEERAAEADLGLAPVRATDLLAMRGVLESGAVDSDPGPLRETLIADAGPLIDDFDAMRESEGAALGAVIGAQVGAIAAGVAAARALADQRADYMADGFRTALARVTENTDGVDEARVAQELALIAVKADVTEELDRLDAHVEAARTLLAETGPKGRKFDFLTQEFNREANTLCAKAGFAELTRVGLDLKHTIDQMREQVQNVE